MSDNKGPEKYRFGWTNCPIDAACGRPRRLQRNSSSDSDSSYSAPQPSSAPLAVSVEAISDDAAPPLIPVMPAAAAAAAATLGQQTQEAPAAVLFPPEPVHYSVFRGLDDEMTKLFIIAEDSRKVADEIKKKIHEADEWLEGNRKYVQNWHETEDEYDERMLHMWGKYGSKSREGPLTLEKIEEAEEVANKIDEVTDTLRTFFHEVPKRFPNHYMEVTPCQFLDSLKGTTHGYTFMKVYPFEQLVQCNLNMNDLEFLKDVVYKESDDVFKELNQDSYMILLQKLIKLQEGSIVDDMVLRNGMTLTNARDALARLSKGGKRNKTSKSKRSKTKSKRSQHRKNKSKRGMRMHAK